MRKLFYTIALLLAASITFTSCSDDEVTIPVTSVTLIGCYPNEPLYIGDTRQLRAVIEPTNATNTAVTWTSSNNSVATVENGLVTARSVGSATITVTTADGGRMAMCAIRVEVPNPGIGNPTPTTDPGVVIAGARWATRNVNAPGTFADNPEDFGMFFQWNRNRGWSATDPLRYWADNDWVAGSWDGSAATGTTWARANDPCPPGWRVPTDAQLRSLNSVGVGSTWTAENGVNGRLFGTAPNQIFLPAAGLRVINHGGLNLVGAVGHYQSSSSGPTTTMWRLIFSNTGGSVTAVDFRTAGLSVRCVAN